MLLAAAGFLFSGKDKSTEVNSKSSISLSILKLIQRDFVFDAKVNVRAGAVVALARGEP